MNEIHDPELRKAMEEIAPVLRNFREELDQATSDARAVETLLTAAELCMEVDHYDLKWQRHGIKGTWRLCFGGKPVLEAKAVERLQAIKYLPGFLRKVRELQK